MGEMRKMEEKKFEREKKLLHQISNRGGWAQSHGEGGGADNSSALPYTFR